MSTDKVQQALQDTIDSYIKNKNQAGKVIAVNGLWGTGKTYLWQSFFQSAKSKQKVYFGVIENIRWVQLIIAILVIISLIDFLCSPYYGYFRDHFLIFCITTLFILVCCYALEWIYCNPIAEIKIYSYVSLFGVNSLDDFKFNLFQNTTRIEHFADKDSKYLMKPFSFTKRLIFPHLKGLSLWFVRLDLTSLAKKGFNSIDNALICIDDLERRGNSLDIKDIMGLVSFLKESRNCTVVLLYNHEAMQAQQDYNIQEKNIKESPENKSIAKQQNNLTYDFELLLEKVIDFSFIFEPNLETRMDIAFKIKTDDYPDLINNNLSEKIREYITQLENIVQEVTGDKSIINIRVIICILTYIGELQPKINNIDVLKELIVQPLIYYVCCKYIKTDQFPDLTIFRDNQRERYNSLVKTVPYQFTILQKYKVLIDDPLERLIRDFVDYGYLLQSEKELIDFINDGDYVVRQECSNNAYSEFWKSFKEFNKSFADLEKLWNKILENNLLFLNPRRFDDVLTIITKLPLKKDKIIEKYIEVNKDYSHFQKSVVRDAFARIENEDLKVALESFKKTTIKNKTINIIQPLYDYINEKKVISDEDYEELVKLDVSYFVTFIKDCCYGFKSQLLKDYLNTQIIKGHPNIVKTKGKIKEALLCLARNSECDGDFELNKIRLKEIFNIDFDEEMKKDQKKNSNINLI